MKKIVLAIDSFKGCLSSEEANQAAAEGIKEIFPDADIHQITVSDGGEGYMQAFHSAIGGKLIETLVRDPLLRPIQAQYLLRDELAVIEMAQASGLTLLTEEERNPMLTTCYGTGQLIADAIRRGAKHIIMGLGGSATSDAGQGMLHALIDSFAPGRHWDDIQELRDIHFTIASDVRNPLCGPQGAAHIFGPQKGASPEMVLQLDKHAHRFAEISARHFGYDYSERPGAGAAGGLGYALMQYLNADSHLGIDLLLNTIRFGEMVKDANWVITGEGSSDRQTLMGKAPLGILRHSAGTPVCLMAGHVEDVDALLQAGFSRVECINPPGLSLAEVLRPETARRNIRDTVRRLLS